MQLVSPLGFAIAHLDVVLSGLLFGTVQHHLKLLFAHWLLVFTDSLGHLG